MKLTRVLGRSVFAFLFGYVIFGSVDCAQAKSICSCPAGSTNLGGGRCRTISCPRNDILTPDGRCDNGDGFDTPIVTISTASCHAGTPQIGQIAASQQQLSFSTVAGVLRTRRDQLQGPLGSESSSTSPGVLPIRRDQLQGPLGSQSSL